MESADTSRQNRVFVKVSNCSSILFVVSDREKNASGSGEGGRKE